MSRALGGSRANTLAVASPLGDSPNYVVLPRGGGRRPPRAASHRTCMGVGPFFFGACETQNSKMFHNSILKYLDITSNYDFFHFETRFVLSTVFRFSQIRIFSDVVLNSTL